MANEHSIRVSARGEFGQLERGLKNLKKDLNSVLGEIDKGARRGGIFDETQLRALDIYRGRFKGTMDELNREFEKQNAIIDELERKKEKSSRTDREDLQKEISGREKKLDVIRKELKALEELNRRRDKESRGYASNPMSSPGAGGAPNSGMGAGAGLLGAGMSKLLGAGKLVAGLAGLAGAVTMAQEAYQLAYQSQTAPMNLSQRLRGNGYEGTAKGMWDEVGNVGRNDSMGYTSQESWQFMDSYSREAGAMNTHELESSLKFGRGYGLEVQETASALSSVRELGGTTSASDFADMIAASVGKSGMTPRILEVMQTSAGLLASMNTSLKDSGAKQILAYQTTLDTIGMEKGMMKLTGEQGANIISGLGGIYSPGQDNDWKYMGMQALQKHDPKKYGDMDMYGLERTFEDGLMNEDNLPAMAGYLKEKSGGNEQLEKRMMQKWLQDGGYNATKTQVDDLYGATDGLTVFDEDKMRAVMKDLENGDGTAKYQERMGQTGQDILDVNARFEKQMENLGQPLLEIVTGLKEGVTNVLEELTGNGTEGIVGEIRDFLQDNWGLLASALGIAGLATLLGKLVPNDGGGKGEKEEKSEKSEKEGKGNKDGKGTPPIVPLVPPSVMGTIIKGAIKGGGIVAGIKSVFDTFNNDDLAKQTKLMKDNGYSDEEIAQNSSHMDRFASNLISNLTLGLLSPEKQIKTFSDDKTDKVMKGTESFFKLFDKNWDVPSTPEEDEALAKAIEKLNDPTRERSIGETLFNPSYWLDGLKGMEIKLPKGMEEYFAGVKERWGGQVDPMKEPGAWDLDGGKKQQAVDALVNLGNSGTVSLVGMSEHGKSKIQELADQGLLKFEEGKTMQTTLLSGFTDAGKTRLQELAEKGLISIGGLTTDGTAKITALSDEGKAELVKLQKDGSAELSTFKAEGSLKITELSEDGAKQLISLQKNGSASLDGMDTTTNEKLELVRKDTSTKLGEIKGEHKTWSDKLVGKDGIFTKWADGATKIFEGIFAWIKDKLPSWLGGGGDSDVGTGLLEGGGKSVTKETKSFESQLAKEGAKYGITDTNLLMAIMNQESKGKAKDVMQSSESLGLARNTLGTDESIKQGVKYFAEALKKAGGDVEMALQAYNYGHGYIAYAKKNGGHSAATAKSYADSKGGKYGDPKYVDHVMQYYPKGSTAGGGGADFFKGWEKRVTSTFGAKEPFRDHVHRGLDISGKQGAPLQALIGGVIDFIKYDDGSKKDADGKKNTRGGGTELGIKMPNGEVYFYSHMSKVADGLKAGDKVQAGQYVGNVGGTPGIAGSGSSTKGAHLHLGYMDKNGQLQDGKKLLKGLNTGDSDIGYMNKPGQLDTMSQVKALKAGDSDIGVSSSSIQKKDITVTLKLDGAGAKQLNGMTESTLRATVMNTIKEYERMKTLLNPSTGGY